VGSQINAGASAAPRAGSNAFRFLGTIRYDFAQSTRTVYFAMAGVMALAFVVALRRMESGRPEEVTNAVTEQPPGDEPATAPVV
jgi:hypothetical protein